MNDLVTKRRRGRHAWSTVGRNLRDFDLASHVVSILLGNSPTILSGFKAGSSDVRKRDFITIREHHPIRLFSNTQYPPLRGTVALPPGKKEYYLYTKGFAPEQSAYAESGTPNPIVVRPHDEVNYSSYREICEEILAFSKLDWNSSDFCKKLPVTVGIADAVSDILAEPLAGELHEKAFPYHYYYYM